MARLTLATLLAFALNVFVINTASAQSSGECQSNSAHKSPVLFVHGFIGKPTAWDLFRKVVERDISNVQTEAFDYSSLNTQWVTNPGIGHRLADYISCMYKESGKRVVVVAHSMGGLAVREAVYEEPQILNDLGMVITIATPNTGSNLDQTTFQEAWSLCFASGIAAICSVQLLEVEGHKRYTCSKDRVEGA